MVAQIGILVFATDLLAHQKIQMAVESTAKQGARTAVLPGLGPADIEEILRQQSSNYGLQPGRLQLSLSPNQPVAGDLVTATASIDGISASARMRVPR